ncbi:MAG: DUF58 domain-containing protein [Frankiaceae bacterium]|nr:DUF58 domain-containing protein [Frankiaceae bacterium]MBV9870330.1 DUF58 domain-containing protein [Frankiaceae bacterium]
MALTGRAVLAAAIGIALVFVAPLGGLMVAVVAVTLLAAVALDLVMAVSPRAIGLRRAGDDSTRLGEPARVTLDVGNPTSRPLRGIVRDGWPPSAGAGPRAWRVDVAAADTARLTSTLVPTRRGERQAAGVTIRSLGPLGLAGRQRTRPAPWTVRVLPAFTSRRILPDKLARLRELDGSIVTLVRGQGSEFDSLRPYVEGDDPRSIDWRATARRDEVVIRTWRPERDRQVMLVLDTGRTAAGRVGGAPRFEATLDAALLLAALSRHAGDRVGVLAHDTRLRVAVDMSRQGDILPSMMRATALLEPRLVETDDGAIAAQVLRRLRRRSLVVWFTAMEPAAIEVGLLPVVGSLVKRHTLLVAAVSDPQLDELSRTRSDASAVYAAAAAEAARNERSRVATMLRQRGVLVVAAPPTEFASKVADAYLDLKAAGRL